MRVQVPQVVVHGDDVEGGEQEVADALLAGVGGGVAALPAKEEYEF